MLSFVYLKIDLSCGKHCTVSPGEDSDGVVVVDVWMEAGHVDMITVQIVLSDRKPILFS